MDEQGRDAADVIDAAELDDGAFKSVPGGSGDGVRGRADGHQVHGGQFSVDIPAMLEEALVRQPAHGESGAGVQHPFPVDTTVEGGGQGGNAGVALKILAAMQDAAHEERSVDGGQFAAEHALAAFDIDEVIQKAVFVRTLF